MGDEQDAAEAFDDDELGRSDADDDGGETWIAPDHLVGAEAYGAAGADPGAPEGVIAREAREVPEDDGDGDLDDQVRLDGEDWDDDAPAEVSAMHAVNEDLGDFDSDVDDPALEAAWELDPEVER